jgi:NAD(P)-dependent dehydrogenase (short-subunit alcohol dehydrogenase family)
VGEKIALVTGASRGIGRGTATALCEAGYTVFATGRSIMSAKLPDEVLRIVCDHRNDDDTARAFATVVGANRRLDLLVNVCWGGYERMTEDGRFTWTVPFWEQPLHRWSSMMDAGVRAAFTCSAHAARSMVPQGSGLIVNIGFWAAQRHLGNVIYGIAKAATDKMTADMAQELAPHGVTAISLYPGLVRTEAVLAAAVSGVFDLSNSESTEFIGRVVAALQNDPRLGERNGEVVVAAAAARELGVLDIDGKSPIPLTLATL